jgi:ubiquinone/menaquinone biosynthesis C-methylase UbiE
MSDGKTISTPIYSLDEAIRTLRRDPQYADLVRDAYLGEDVQNSAERFLDSAEFAEVRILLNRQFKGKIILDLGAGTGIAAYAFAKSGAKQVFALEPDPSAEVGTGAIRRISDGLPILLVNGVGEAIPLLSNTLDIVYARQVLHHTHDLSLVMRECARILRSSGMFLACREHVVDDDQQLREFLATHPIHQLAGGENAFPLDQYVSDINAAGLKLVQVIGPWDSLINAFPQVRSATAFERMPRTVLERRFGRLGALASYIPGIQQFVWKRIRRPTPPGRMYSFLAIKP